MLTATATFSDGGIDTQPYHDVVITGLTRLKSSSQEVLGIDSGTGTRVLSPTGDGHGPVTITAESATGAKLGSIKVVVTDTRLDNQIAVIGLDVGVFKSFPNVLLNASKRNTVFPRNAEVEVSIAAPDTIPLQLEGDSMRVLVSAVLEDHSRISVSNVNGLELRSLRNRSLLVTDGQSVTVPFDPQPFNGSLLRVAWRPNLGGCAKVGLGLGKFSSTTVTLAVTPPQAIAMTATLDAPFIISADGVAAKSGAFSTIDQIRVTLTFPGGRKVKNLERDVRCNFAVDIAAPFTVSTEGLVVPKGGGIIGTGIVMISFIRQVVTANVTVSVTKFSHLAVASRPRPAYPGSEAVNASVLAKIQDSVPVAYEQGAIMTTMVLQNDVTTLIPSAATSIEVVAGDIKIISISAQGVITAAQAGKVHYGAPHHRRSGAYLSHVPILPV